MKFDKLLKNKYLYYAAVALMVINVLGYVAMGSIECILVLGGAAYLAQHFTKNRTVDILIGIFVANILFGCGRLKEGMEDSMEKGSDKLKKAAQKLNREAMEEGADANACPAGQEKDASGKCADVKGAAAQGALQAAKSVDASDKEKKAVKEKAGFFA